MHNLYLPKRTWLIKDNKRTWPHFYSFQQWPLIMLSIMNSYTFLQFSKCLLSKIFHIFSFLTHLMVSYMNLHLTSIPYTSQYVLIVLELNVYIISQLWSFVLPRCLPLSPVCQQTSFSPFKTLLKGKPPQTAKSKFIMHYSL